MTWWLRLKHYFAPPVFPDAAEKTRVAALLNVMLLALAAVGLLAVLATLAVGGGTAGVVESVVLAAIFSLGLWFVMRRGYVRPVSIFFTLLLFVAATVSSYSGGTLRAPPVSAFVLSVVVAGLLLGARGLIVFTVMVLAALLLLLVGELSGALPAPVAGPVGLVQWFTYAAIFGMVAILLGLTTRGLNSALAQARQAMQELEARRQQLDVLVEERTQELVRRTSYLEATTLVAQEAASILDDPQRLLERAAQVIAERFGFYHVGIFLLDAAGEWAVLQAVSSEGGRRMLARKYQLRIGAQGMVGYVAAQGRSRVASDVGTEAIFFHNPDLPQTRAEAALPLKIHDTVIGVLDVQSAMPLVFDEAALDALQALADQVAVAVANARLFLQVRESVAAERHGLTDLRSTSWADALTRTPDLGFLSTAQELKPTDQWRPEMLSALRTGERVLGEPASPGLAAAAGALNLAIPLRVRGEIIGVIDGRKASQDGPWKPEEIALLESFAEQLNVAVESARLYEESQRRALRERLIAEVSGRLRASRDVETVLQATLRELGQAFDAVGVIRMTPLAADETVESEQVG